MDLPAKIINELHNLTASLPTAKEPTAWPWQPAAEQKAFMLVSLLSADWLLLTWNTPTICEFLNNGYLINGAPEQ